MEQAIGLRPPLSLGCHRRPACLATRLGPSRTSRVACSRLAVRSKTRTLAVSSSSSSQESSAVIEQTQKATEPAKNAKQEDEVELAKDEYDEVEYEKGYSMKKVCDKLIEVFMVERPDPEEWRKLLAFSHEWKKIRPFFYKRCNALAEAEEDPRRMGSLYKLSRRLKEVDDEMARHDSLVDELDSQESDMNAIVAKRRQDFTSDFFKHFRILCEANYHDPIRRDKLAELATRCLAAVEDYDKVVGDTDALAVARAKFDDILNSPSLEAACNKIDQLAKTKQFDPALMLLISKAWASAKEAPMMKDEVKDIMFHLYNVAKGNMQRLVPKEVRILKHLLTIEDPRQRLAALTQAFSPGDELEGKDIDLLYTTPIRLYNQIEFILKAYQDNKAQTLIQEAQKLMDPAVISRLSFLKDVIKDEFL